MPPQHETEAFCLALKTARKKRGLTLESIADATKVCVSYYAALEANDLRRWPKGLFRRSFFRGYVEAIGLPATEMTDEFIRLFPEDDRTENAAPPPTETPVRLSLDESWHGARPPIGARVATAMIDAVVVAAVAGTVALLSRFDFAPAAAAMSIGYFTLATLVLGETPAAWLRRWLPTITTRVASGSAEPEGAADGSTEREWVSDARRVRPRETTARLRVRFKTQ